MNKQNKENWTPLYRGEVKRLSRRHRHLARLDFSHPEWDRHQLAEASGYGRHQGYLIQRSRVYKDYMAQLERRQEDALLDYRKIINIAALQATKRLIAIVTPGTKENSAATIREQIEAAYQLLDRVVPKVKKPAAVQQVNNALTQDELDQITGRKKPQAKQGIPGVAVVDESSKMDSLY